MIFIKTFYKNNCFSGYGFSFKEQPRKFTQYTGTGPTVSRVFLLSSIATLFIYSWFFTAILKKNSAFPILISDFSAYKIRKFMIIPIPDPCCGL